jgi:uncharacterized membrane protein YphA (DoxX/SURF4 family)
MTDATLNLPVSASARWTGRVLAILPALLLLFSGAAKLAGGPSLKEGFDHLGWPIGAAVPLGIVEIVSTLLFLIPRTSVLGAVLLTGYMGGAIATHVRIGEGFVAQAALGVVLWLSIYLRNPKLRALLPLTR